MLFIETSIFENQVYNYLSDDEYGNLQAFLSNNPDSGAIVRGTGGLRKVRWAIEGKGKRGGVRVIYYWISREHQIHLITIYGKGVKDDLTPAERTAFKRLVKEL